MIALAVDLPVPLDSVISKKTISCWASDACYVCSVVMVIGLKKPGMISGSQVHLHILVKILYIRNIQIILTSELLQNSTEPN